MSVAAEHDRIPEAALGWLAAGKRAALATVIQTWGSAPRPVGSQLAISSEAEIVGSVSGGCVEGAVVVEALDALADGTPRILEYGVSDDEAFSVGLACGGVIRILVEPLDMGAGPDRGLIERLAAARDARRAAVYAVNLRNWDRMLLDDAAANPLGDPVRAALAADKSAEAEISGARWFLGVHNPPLRMMVVGAVHIAQPLLRMARLAGYDAVLIDPRDAFSAGTRFPDETILRYWPDEALRTLGVDARTAVVTLSHDPKLDDPAIAEALRSPCFYLGCLGSTKTHAKRVARLTGAGFAKADIARIHAPVGLDVGAKSPAEIAIAILAQITERLRRPQTRPGVLPNIRRAAT